MTKIDFRTRYKAQTSELLKTLEVGNVNALPQLKKITINVGTGRFRGNKDMLAFIEGSLRQITGQKPAITRANKSIAGFKLRQGEEIGMKVTLRGSKMHDFLDRMINIAIPRIREFRGFDAKNFDNQGNLTIGFSEVIPFAELGHAALDRSFGLSVTLTIGNSNKEKSYNLLKTLGLPVKID